MKDIAAQNQVTMKDVVVASLAVLNKVDRLREARKAAMEKGEPNGEIPTDILLDLLYPWMDRK